MLRCGAAVLALSGMPAISNFQMNGEYRVDTTWSLARPVYVQSKNGQLMTGGKFFLILLAKAHARPIGHVPIPHGREHVPYSSPHPPSHEGIGRRACSKATPQATRG